MKRNTWMRVALGAAVLLMASTAVADEQLVGIGGQYWGLRFTASTTPACVKRGTGGTGASACAIFPSGSTADHLRKATTVIADGAACCCWMMGTGTEQTIVPASCQVSEQNNISSGVGSGPGACFAFGALGGTWQNRASRKALIDTLAAGQRSGLCSTTTATTGDTLFMGCDADADCSTTESGVHTGGTCLTSGLDAAVSVSGASTTYSSIPGMTLFCASLSGSVPMFVGKDRVIK